MAILETTPTTLTARTVARVATGSPAEKVETAEMAVSAAAPEEMEGSETLGVKAATAAWAIRTAGREAPVATVTPGRRALVAEAAMEALRVETATLVPAGPVGTAGLPRMQVGVRRDLARRRPKVLVTGAAAERAVMPIPETREQREAEEKAAMVATRTTSAAEMEDEAAMADPARRAREAAQTALAATAVAAVEVKASRAKAAPPTSLRASATAIQEKMESTATPASGSGFRSTSTSTSDLAGEVTTTSDLEFRLAGGRIR